MEGISSNFDQCTRDCHSTFAGTFSPMLEQRVLIKAAKRLHLRKLTQLRNCNLLIMNNDCSSADSLNIS